MSVLAWKSFIVECRRNNGIMVLLKTLRKTMRHKYATIFHCGHCVSLSLSKVLTQSFSVLKVFDEMYKYRYLTNKYSYRADFTDLNAVYGSDDGLKRKFIEVKHFFDLSWKMLEPTNFETDYRCHILK